ncbi:MAG: hypothetical protein IPH71_07370 [Proteobacteria bacterium]|jgi:hypothetical protein|nr:hypothetical protein [Pseudomonadota bacterium]
MSDKGMSRRAMLGGIAALGVTTGSGKALAATHTFSPVQRFFSDPYIELIRLLKEGVEIEHDLMVQYLYGAFSLKPTYATVVGAPAPNATSLMGVIVEEMRHLAAVNRLLVELDAKPQLTRQDFPYETDAYPFPFEMAPLGQNSLAKFVYCEADKTRLKRARSVVDDSYLIDKLKGTLGPNLVPNHVGNLYDAIIETILEVKKAGGVKLDYDAWYEGLGNIKADGEFGHFKFFQSLYEGAHPVLKEVPGVWSLPADDALYPCYQVPVNPTAYEGRPNTIKDPDMRSLAWLGNLNYWSQLLLLDQGYRRKSKTETALAQAIMMGPLYSIAQYLPTKGAAVPFDPLSMGFDPGINEAAGRRFTRRMLQETRDYARKIDKLLPGNFDLKIYDQLMAAV